MTKHEQGQKFIIDKIKTDLAKIEKESKGMDLVFDLVMLLKSLEVVPENEIINKNPKRITFIKAPIFISADHLEIKYVFNLRVKMSKYYTYEDQAQRVGEIMAKRYKMKFTGFGSIDDCICGIDKFSVNIYLKKNKKIQ